MELNVINKEGKETGRKVVLSEEVFAVEPNEHVVWLDIKQYLANQRQGTHKSKERAEVNRTSKKLHRQKGTGGARHGSRRAPIFVGGGTIFGPRPRNYSFKLNKKVKSLARKSVLSDKAKNAKITIIEDFSFEAPKTKGYIDFLNAIGMNGQKTLFIVDGVDNNIYLSARNIPRTFITEKNEVSAYDLMNADQVLISESSVKFLETILN
ncbi:LSU ribosomal protein L4P [Spirosomataceae bacterium TFI 002]|nr:LSU ribosomal protein L4P [Spirosomataceae bacterium TFI 002]